MSATGNLYLLLEDVDTRGEDKIWTARHSTWLNLETGEARWIDGCKRELLKIGWRWFE
jgi:hypothetical protein